MSEEPVKKRFPKRKTRPEFLYQGTTRVDSPSEPSKEEAGPSCSTVVRSGLDRTNAYSFLASTSKEGRSAISSGSAPLRGRGLTNVRRGGPPVSNVSRSIRGGGPRGKLPGRPTSEESKRESIEEIRARLYKIWADNGRLLVDEYDPTECIPLPEKSSTKKTFDMGRKNEDRPEAKFGANPRHIPIDKPGTSHMDDRTMESRVLLEKPAFYPNRQPYNKPPRVFLTEVKLQERISYRSRNDEEVANFKLQKISTFLIRKRDDAYAPVNLMDNYLLDKVDQARVSAFEMKKLYKETDYPPRMEIETSCPEIIHRQRYSSYLRPVYIDGCGISFDFFNGGTTYRKKLVEKENTIPLMMYPVVQTLLVYILMGHKTIVGFPTRYKELLDVEESTEIDRLDIFKKLYKVGLLEFWEKPQEEKGDIVDAVIKEYSKIGAGIVITPQSKNIREFTKAHLHHIRVDKYRGYNTEKRGGHVREVITATVFPTKPALSHNLLMSVTVSGGRNDFVFVSASSRFFYSVEKNETTQKRKYTYLQVVKPQKLFYTPLLGDVADVQTKMDNQITIQQQVSWVMELIQMYDLPSPHMYAVMILFRFLYKEELCMTELLIFMENYPALPEPASLPPVKKEDTKKRRKWKYEPDLPIFEQKYSKWKQQTVSRIKIREEFKKGLEKKERPPSPRAPRAPRVSRTIAILGKPPTSSEPPGPSSSNSSK